MCIYKWSSVCAHCDDIIDGALYAKTIQLFEQFDVMVDVTLIEYTDNTRAVKQSLCEYSLFRNLIAIVLWFGLLCVLPTMCIAPCART